MSYQAVYTYDNFVIDFKYFSTLLNRFRGNLKLFEVTLSYTYI